MDFAKKNNIKISIDLGDPGIVSRNKDDIKKMIKEYVREMDYKSQPKLAQSVYKNIEPNEMPTPIDEAEIKTVTESPQYIPKPRSDSSYDYGFFETGYTPPYAPSPQYAPVSPQYAPVSPPYVPGSNSPQYAPGSPQYAPGSNSPPYSPGSPYVPGSPYAPGSNSPPYAPGSPQYAPTSPVIQTNKPIEINPSILEVPKEEKETQPSEIASEETTKVIEVPDESSSTPTTSSGIKKITI
jgi:hypothetical protein